MASLFGITSPKYQYAIDEYYRMKKEVRCLVFVESIYLQTLECFITTTLLLLHDVVCNILASHSWCDWQEDEEEEENRLSAEAERHFEEEHNQEIQQPAMEQPEGKASFVNVSFELDQDPTPEPNRCPAPIPT